MRSRRASHGSARPLNCGVMRHIEDGGGSMSHFRTLALCALALLPLLAVAQVKRDFIGKWVVDRERMSEVDPAWDGVLTDEMWIVTGFRNGLFFVSRNRDDIQSYDPSGTPTTMFVENVEGIARAQWQGDRLVVQITVPIQRRSFTRVIYREGRWLVVEDQGRPDARWERTFFTKT
jgi:hypothetical protein